MKIKRILAVITGLFIITSVFSADLNIYDEYQKARKFYFEKDFTKAAFSLEKVLNQVPDYDEAKLLYFKVRYETGERFKVDIKDSYEFVYRKGEGTTTSAAKLFYELIKTNDETRKNLFSYLMLQDETELLEVVYDSFDNKTYLKDIFLEYLFINKEYTKITQKYPDIRYTSKIEENKSKADSYYFAALKMLKENKTMDALALMQDAIYSYPENYIYYFKTGQVYADNKNFDLAEYNFLKALELNELDDIKINLFNLYYIQKKYNKAYNISRDISSVPEIREKLKNMYYVQENKDVYIKIITREGNKIGVDKRLITREREISIGDTFMLNTPLTGIYDDKTGEKLATRSEKTARIRVSNIEEKLVTFEIVEEYIVVLVEKEYIIGKKEELWTQCY